MRIGQGKIINFLAGDIFLIIVHTTLKTHIDDIILCDRICIILDLIVAATGCTNECIPLNLRGETLYPHHVRLLRPLKLN